MVRPIIYAFVLKRIHQSFYMSTPIVEVAVNTLPVHHPDVARYQYLLPSIATLANCPHAYYCQLKNEIGEVWTVYLVGTDKSVMFELWKKEDEVIAYEYYEMGGCLYENV